MSLYKIFLIGFLTHDFILVLIAPQPDPSKEEKAKTIAIDVPRVREWRLAFARAGQVLLATLEIFCIIYHNLPPSIHSTITRRAPVTQLDRILPQLRTTRIQTLGAVIWLIGTRLRLTAFAQLGHFFRFDISIQRAHKLITSGPYAYVRHPAYTGLLLLNIGWMCYHFAPGGWLRESALLESWLGTLLVCVYVGVGLFPTVIVTFGRMWREERMLRKAFGNEWEEWARRVPSKIIPGIY